MKYQIPGVGEVELTTIILDLNGTMTVGGEIVEGLLEHIAKIKELGFRVLFFTGDTRGNASEIANHLGIEFIKASTGEDKKKESEKLDPLNCVAIGNGLIDLKLMETVKLGIVTLQAEGVHTKTLLAADIVVPTIIDALNLFIDSERLVATLRL